MYKLWMSVIGVLIFGAQLCWASKDALSVSNWGYLVAKSEQISCAHLKARYDSLDHLLNIVKIFSPNSKSQELVFERYSVSKNSTIRTDEWSDKVLNVDFKIDLIEQPDMIGVKANNTFEVRSIEDIKEMKTHLYLDDSLTLNVSTQLSTGAVCFNQPVELYLYNDCPVEQISFLPCDGYDDCGIDKFIQFNKCKSIKKYSLDLTKWSKEFGKKNKRMGRR